MSKPRYYVDTFGNDCLGNISGYLVRDRQNLDPFSALSCPTYVASIYRPGSFVQAKQAAETECERLNGGTR